MSRKLPAAVLVAVFAGILVAVAAATLGLAAPATAQSGPRLVLRDGEPGRYVVAAENWVWPLPTQCWLETESGLEPWFEISWSGDYTSTERLFVISDQGDTLTKIGFYEFGEGPKEFEALSESARGWVPVCEDGEMFCGWVRVDDPTPTPTPPVVPPVVVEYFVYLPSVQRAGD